MTAKVNRTPVHVYDAPDGTRWRGGIVLRLYRDEADRELAVVRILAEHGSPREYTGPASLLPCQQINVPIVARMVGDFRYRIAELRHSDWASFDDAWRVKQGEPGIYGIVPHDVIIEQVET